MRYPALAASICAFSIAFAGSAIAQEIRVAEPDPPWIDPGPPAPSDRSAGSSATQFFATQSFATQEWLLHKTLDGQHPDGNEQALVWLMNWARQDPTAEGIWLATSSDSQIASGRSYFGVDLDLLQDEFAAIAPAPPAAFDRRLYEASLAHSLDLIARDAQDHNGQFARVDASGFVYTGGRASVFSYARSALNAHAAFNIDWGPGDGTGMQPGRGHRLAIMGGYTNVGIAAVPENDRTTSVGPLVVSAAYLYARSSEADHYNRFLVGTVWNDLDTNGMYDPGEGLGGITVRPMPGTFHATTSEAGGYAIPILSAGSYDVTFSGGDLVGAYQRTVVIGADSVLLDLEPTAAPEPDRALLGTVALLTLASWTRVRSRVSRGR